MKKFVEVPLLNEDGQSIFPERFPTQSIEAMRKSQGSYVFACNPYRCPIWMADGTFKPIGEIVEGDVVVGFTIGANGEKSKLVPSKVLKVMSRQAQTQEVVFEDGEKIECTPDHNWYMKRNGQDGHSPYLPAKVGRTLHKVINPVDCNTAYPEHQYLGGIIDGEGACKHGSIAIVQSKDKNPKVHKKIKDVLELLNIPYNTYQDKRKSKRATHWFLKGGKQTKVNIINLCLPAKAEQIMSTIYKDSTCFIQESKKVFEINPKGVTEVFSMETTTGNYVAWGYASKNCQNLLTPVAPEDQKFQVSWIKRYDNLPKDIVLFACIDPASSKKKGSDYTAAMIMGIDSKRNWYIYKAIRDKFSPKERVDFVFKIHERCKGLSQRPFFFIYETVGFQSTDKYTIQIEQQKRGIYFNIEEIKNYSKRKADRIQGLQPLYENGNVHWPKKSMYYSTFHKRQIDMIEELKYEYELFTPSLKGLKHDDLMDCHSFPLYLDDLRNLKARPIEPEKPKVPEFSINNLMERERMTKMSAEEYLGRG